MREDQKVIIAEAAYYAQEPDLMKMFRALASLDKPQRRKVEAFLREVQGAAVKA